MKIKFNVTASSCPTRGLHMRAESECGSWIFHKYGIDHGQERVVELNAQLAKLSAILMDLHESHEAYAGLDAQYDELMAERDVLLEANAGSFELEAKMAMCFRARSMRPTLVERPEDGWLRGPMPR